MYKIIMIFKIIDNVEKFVYITGLNVLVFNEILKMSNLLKKLKCMVNCSNWRPNHQIDTHFKVQGWSLLNPWKKLWVPSNLSKFSNPKWLGGEGQTVRL